MAGCASMYFNTALLDFSVAAEAVTDPARWRLLQQRTEAVLTAAVPGLTPGTLPSAASNSRLVHYSAAADTTVCLRAHHTGLVSIHMENIGNTFIIGNQELLQLESRLSEALSAHRAKTILPLSRGRQPDTFFYTSDERLLEYSVLEVLFDERTPHQRVQVVRTPEFGNALVLDGFINIAESDDAYTRALMDGRDFSDKTVLILGGGDGALLRQLLTHAPRHVTMVEIDDVVMRECRKHLRSVCGSCLDNYQADNYQVLVGDAFAYLRECQQKGRRFDYVLYDLSDVPVSAERELGVWQMVRTALADSLQVLQPGGTYLTHVTGVGNTDGLQTFETMLDELPMKTTHTRSQALVPSFLETWVFYQITRC